MLVSVAVPYVSISVTVNVPDNKACQSFLSFFAVPYFYVSVTVNVPDHKTCQSFFAVPYFYVSMTVNVPDHKTCWSLLLFLISIFQWLLMYLITKHDNQFFCCSLFFITKCVSYLLFFAVSYFDVSVTVNVPDNKACQSFCCCSLLLCFNDC